MTSRPRSRGMRSLFRAAARLLGLLLIARGASAVGASDLVDVSVNVPGVVLDLRYATTDNFVGQVLYDSATCLLRPEVAKMLTRAQQELQRRHPGHVLVLKDCYRPLSVQRRLWNMVRGTPKRRYVANPDSPTGSVHCYGAAVDVTVRGPDGLELDMGTPYDFLGPLAEVRLEQDMVRAGELTRTQVDNRRILRTAMRDGGGFLVTAREWWHFDALRGAALRARYQPLDEPLRAAP